MLFISVISREVSFTGIVTFLCIEKLFNVNSYGRLYHCVLCVRLD